MAAEAEYSAGQLVFTISGDASGMLEAARQTERAASNMQNAISEASKMFDSLADAMAQAATASANMQQKTTTATTSVNNTSKAAATAVGAFGSLGGAVSQVKEEFTGMGSVLGNSATRVNTSTNDMATSLQRVANQSNNAWSALGSLSGQPAAQIHKTADAVQRVIALLRLEAQTAGMSTNIKQLYMASIRGATQAELEEIAALQKLAVVNNSANNAMNTSTGGLRTMRGAAQGLGYQIQDVAVQLQMGASAFTVLGQQGAQVASIFGPGGAVIGAIIAVAAAIGGALINSLRGANAEFDAMTTKVGELQAAQRRVATDEISSKLEKVNAKIKEFSTGVDAAGVAGTGWSKTISFNSEGLNKQAAALESLKQEQKSYQDRLKELAGGATKESTDANNDWRLSVQAGTIALRDGEKQAAIFVRTQELLKKANENGQAPEVTQQQIKDDTALIEKQYEAQAAHDAKMKAQTAATSAAKKDTTQQQQNAQRLQDSALKVKQLEQELANLTNGTEEGTEATGRYTIESARLEAQQQLNAAATPKQTEALAQQILTVHQLTEKIAALKKKQAEDTKTTQSFETVEKKTGTKGENVDAQYKEDLKALENYHKMAGASNSRYEKTKNKLEEKYRKDKQAAAIEDYKAQSEWNTFLMDGLDALGQSATTTIAGLASGTMTATEAMQNFANIILNQAVGALVSMGIEAIKNQIVGQTAAAASVMAAEATGAALTSAYAPAAFMANTATMGGASATGLETLQAGVMASKALGVVGGRQFGGGVNAGGMYRVGENGRAEVLTQGGRNYLLPGDSGGQVTPLSGLGGNGFSQQVNITNTAGANVSTNSSADGKQLNIMIDQRVSQSIRKKQGMIARAFRGSTNTSWRAQ